MMINRTMLNEWNFREFLDAKTPNYGIGLPQVERTGAIKYIFDKKNPIRIVLSDGTNFYMTIDEFRRLPRKPNIGDQIKGTFLNDPTTHQMTLLRFQFLQ